MQYKRFYSVVGGRAEAVIDTKQGRPDGREKEENNGIRRTTGRHVDFWERSGKWKGTLVKKSNKNSVQKTLLELGGIGG